MALRRILFLLLVAVPLLTQAQEKIYSVTYEDVTAEAVIKDLTKRTGYEFVYQKPLVEGLPTITLILRDATLQQILNRTLVAQCGLEYNFVKQTIVLRKATGTRVIKRTITGMVTDEQLNLLPGVSVRLRGTNVGVLTDIDGQFSILVEGPDPYLDFTYMGMKPASVHITPKLKDMVAVTMKEMENIMQEVLVTGYQNIKRENATGSYQLISSKTLDQRYTGDVIKNLEGRVPGLVNYNTGMGSGGESDIVIRGTGSFNARTNPLVVVDGLPIEGGLNSINPYNIETITVLKDAAAASIYGARASNGVIVVTTKRAQKERMEVDFSADLQVSERNDYSDMRWANAAELIELERYNLQYVRYYPSTAAWKNIQNYYTSNRGALSPIQRLLMAQIKGDITKSDLDAQLAALSANDYVREWQDVWERPQITQQYNLSLRNQGKHLNSSIVLNFKGDNLGHTQEHDRALTFSYRGDATVTKWLTTEFGVNIINDRQRIHIPSQWNSVTSFAPYMSMYNADGSPAAMEAETYLLEPSLSNAALGLKSEAYSPLDEVDRNFSNNRETNIRSYVHAKANILEGLTASAMFQYEDIYSKNEAYREAESYDMRHLYNLYTSTTGTHYMPDGGELSTQSSEGAYYTFRTQADFNHVWNERHVLEALAGFEFRESHFKSANSLYAGWDEMSQTNNMGLMNFKQLKDLEGAQSALGTNYSMVGAPDGSAFTTSDVLHRFYSLYANANYTYDHRYSLSGSVRLDKADLFGADPEFRGRPLWSVGAGWNLENEAFMQDVKWVDALKLRASYGLTGNIAQDFSSYLTATVGINEINGSRVASLNTPPNEQLRWEKTASFNAGFDFALWRGRLTGAFDFYRNQGSDLLTVTDLDPTTGWTSLTINNGELRNTGVELQLNGEILRPKSRDQFGLSASLSLAYNKNTITHVNHTPTSGDEALQVWTFHEGYPVHSLFSYRYAGMVTQKGIQYFSWFDANGQAHTADITTDEFTPNDVVYSGSLDPTLSGSFTPQLTWKGFSLTAMLAYYGGHVMRARFEDWTSDGSQYGYYNMAEMDAVPASYLNFWRNPDSNQFPGNGYAGSTNVVGSGRYLDANVVPADYLKLRNVVLGYEFDHSLCQRLHLQSLRVRLQANNLWTWCRNSLDIDPEACNPTGGETSLRTPRSYAFSLSASF